MKFRNQIENTLSTLLLHSDHSDELVSAICDDCEVPEMIINEVTEQIVCEEHMVRLRAVCDDLKNEKLAEGWEVSQFSTDIEKYADVIKPSSVSSISDAIEEVVTISTKFQKQESQQTALRDEITQLQNDVLKLKESCDDYSTDGDMNREKETRKQYSSQSCDLISLLDTCIEQQTSTAHQNSQITLSSINTLADVISSQQFDFDVRMKEADDTEVQIDQYNGRISSELYLCKKRRSQTSKKINLMMEMQVASKQLVCKLILKIENEIEVMTNRKKQMIEEIKIRKGQDQHSDRITKSSKDNNQQTHSIICRKRLLRDKSKNCISILSNLKNIISNSVEKLMTRTNCVQILKNCKTVSKQTILECYANTTNLLSRLTPQRDSASIIFCKSILKTIEPRISNTNKTFIKHQFASRKSELSDFKKFSSLTEDQKLHLERHSVARMNQLLSSGDSKMLNINEIPPVYIKNQVVNKVIPIIPFGHHHQPAAVVTGFSNSTHDIPIGNIPHQNDYDESNIINDIIRNRSKKKTNINDNQKTETNTAVTGDIFPRKSSTVAVIDSIRITNIKQQHNKTQSSKTAIIDMNDVNTISCNTWRELDSCCGDVVPGCVSETTPELESYYTMSTYPMDVAEECRLSEVEKKRQLGSKRSESVVATSIPVNSSTVENELTIRRHVKNENCNSSRDNTTWIGHYKANSLLSKKKTSRSTSCLSRKQSTIISGSDTENTSIQLWDGEPLLPSAQLDGVAITHRNFRVMQPHGVIFDSFSRLGIGIIIKQVNDALMSKRESFVLRLEIKYFFPGLPSVLQSTYHIYCEILEMTGSHVVLKLQLEQHDDD